MSNMSSIKIPEELLPSSTFACGPSQGHPEIKKTRIGEIPFERSHRASDITKDGLIKETTENIRNLLKIPNDYAIIFFLGGATPALDSICWSLSTTSVSGLRFGAFSKLWGSQIGNLLDPSIEKKFIDCKEGEQFPSEQPDWNSSLVILTPNETSTGVCIPNDYLEMAWNKKGKDTLIAWDLTSCAGGRVLPINQYDAAAFSFQKCFGSPGGTGLLVLSPRAMERAKQVSKERKIPYSLNLEEPIMRAIEKRETLNTPSTLTIWMANEACKWMLNKGGLEGMDQLVKRHADVLWKWAEKSLYAKPLVKDSRFRSNTTTTFRMDDNLDTSEINKSLKSTGRANLADGVKKYSSVKENSIRIACFPFVDIHGTEQFEKLTKTLDFIVENMGNAG